MGKNAQGRVALMSIRPEFSDAILSGEKVVEFRKRPVADDVSHVLIYATMPVGSLVGWFAVRGQKTMSPKELWSTFRAVGGISKCRFFEYYDQREQGTGILVDSAARFPRPVPLSELGTSLRPPQSFQYLTAAQSDTFFEMVRTQPSDELESELYPLARVG
ncbi:hypothetical protein V1638_13710 [Pseudarthrobacter sp. J64]|uniref:hypothetical protein n=1 Tax=Pseudarthrobacter sp. J64 TaxID=3116485 RepID=UPI002E81EF2C|nr:hypothetical protein [Pseudarthrobacter sp. J64]MEE2570443.1 hypothetical protein [Pseudarthrobacter sp. J64]